MTERHGRLSRWTSRRRFGSPQPVLVIAVALLVAAVVGVAVAWLAVGLPAHWQAALAVGVTLTAAAVAVGARILTRARRELSAAQQILETAVGELARVNDDLRQTAGARDRALAELRASIEDRKMFLNSVAHDLNSPLTVVKGNAELLAGVLRRGELPERDKLARGITRIAESAQILADLVDELLWLARLDVEQRVTLDRRPTDLIALTREIVAQQSATTARHRIRFEPGRDQLVGNWDARRLGRAIGNLVGNAIKYSPEGGEIRVAVATEAPDSVAVVTVQDQGLGIPAAELSRVFERFYRGERVKLRVEGTGVGLATVKHVVEAHGGSVAVDSREGRGTTFTVRLPIDGSGEAEGGPAPESPQARSERGRPADG